MTIRPGLVALATAALFVPPTSAGSPHTLAMVPGGAVASAPDVVRKPAAPNLATPRYTVAAERVVRAGEFAEVHVRTENVGGNGTFSVAFGDGTAGPGWALATTPPDCTGGLAPGVRAHDVYRHAYRAPGTYAVTVTFTPSCGGTSPVVGRGTVTVLPGRVLSNGPEPLAFDTGSPLDVAPAGGLEVVAFPNFVDPDGHVARIVYSWGDGTPDAVFGDLADCVDSARRWPTTEFTADPPAGRQVTHAYARAGTYRVTVTVTTSGCDGRDADTATATATAVVPAA